MSRSWCWYTSFWLYYLHHGAVVASNINENIALVTMVYIAILTHNSTFIVFDDTVSGYLVLLLHCFHAAFTIRQLNYVTRRLFIKFLMFLNTTKPSILMSRSILLVQFISLKSTMPATVFDKFGRDNVLVQSPWIYHMQLRSLVRFKSILENVSTIFYNVKYL